MVNMVVIVPTRGRPDNARRLFDQFKTTVLDPENVDLWFAVDDDDSELQGYLDLQADGAQVTVGPRLRMAGTLNMVAVALSSIYDVVGFLGDDHLPRTMHWDSEIAAEASKPGAIVYGNDLIMGENLPTAVFMDARIIRKVGYMVPPGFIHLFLDNTWKTWGTRAGTLKYLPRIIIEHLHPLAGTAKNDEQYVEVNSSAVWQADEKRFDEYVQSGDLDHDVEIIQNIVRAYTP